MSSSDRGAGPLPECRGSQPAFKRRSFLAALAFNAACARREPAFERVAVLPFDDQSGGAGMDWKGRGIAEALALALTGTPRRDAFGAAALRDAALSRATHVVHGYFVRGRAHAALEQLASSRIVAAADASGTDAGALGYALARALDPHARSTAPPREDALRRFVDGDFSAAAAADPDFGAAYAAWAQRALARGDRAAAGQALAAARARGGRIQPPERARLEWTAAVLSGDREAQRRALLDLSRAVPASAAAFRGLADLDTASRSYARAAEWCRQAIARDPDPVLFNSLGYVRAYAGDLEDAVRALQRYRELRPNDANPLDSLGDVHYYLGRLAEAERFYLEAHAKDPAFTGGGPLYKAAWAKLLAGDVKKADEHAQRFFELRDRLRYAPAPLFRAQWEFITGRREQAAQRAAGIPAAAAHLAVWALETGDRATARKQTDRVPPESAAGQALRAALQPDAAPAGTPASLLGAGYGRMLARRPADAVPAFQRLLELSPPNSPEPVEMLLGWALLESGRSGDAAPLLARNPIPDVLADHPFFALVYPRLVNLRANRGQGI